MEVRAKIDGHLLCEFYFSHVKSTNAGYFIAAVDDSWCLPLSARQNNVYKFARVWHWGHVRRIHLALSGVGQDTRACCVQRPGSMLARGRPAAAVSTSAAAETKISDSSDSTTS